MQVSPINYTKTTFTSLKNPIPPETFISKLGKITICEAVEKDIKEVAKLIRRNQAQSYKIQNCYGGREQTKQAREFLRSINKNQWVKDIKEHLMSILHKPDGKSTLLVVKTDEDKIVGYATLQSMDKVAASHGVVEDLHLDFDYTKGNLGHYLLYKITKNGYGQFKDIYAPCCGMSGTTPLLRELGYEILPETSNASKFLNREYNNNYTNQAWARKVL